MTTRSRFVDRHIGPSDADVTAMLNTLSVKSLEELMNKSTPQAVRTSFQMDLGPGLSEQEFLQRARAVADRNSVYKSYIGQGYYDTATPSVILRNVLENPGWYTAYTPYQAEISQGRMEALLNFQTMVVDLTGLPVANASLLDEATAAAEAMALSFHSQKKAIRHKFFVDRDTFAQTRNVLSTRAKPIGIDIEFGSAAELLSKKSSLADYFAIFVQAPTATGLIQDWSKLASAIHTTGGHLIIAADVMALTMMKTPGEMGADIAVGNTQRFGVPMGFGGPHAAYLSVREEFLRLIPGRIIGLSKDVHGNPALRLALQTREQHIRREKATSNICTAQVLLAVMASMYAVYHGPAGVRKIAETIHRQTSRLATMLIQAGYTLVHKKFFDTICLRLNSPADVQRCLLEFQKDGINLGDGKWLGQEHASDILVSINETTTDEDLLELAEIFAKFVKAKSPTSALGQLRIDGELAWDNDNFRETSYFTHPSFNSYQSETEMLRYIHRLERKDLALNQSMIPLGSCTMKLNATSEMLPVTWSEFGGLHPYVPETQAAGYLELIYQLENWLAQMTGFAAVSFQPNAGSQGEFAGLLAIRGYLEKKGQGHRNICLIPTSAHGTNPASAVMAGFKVVPVSCDGEGNVQVDDLKAKAAQYADNLAALMITYPSTHGVFENSIRDICDVIHEHGGQVYWDGANFNALVGITRPADFGADVCHLNLHKTFCIPHGGGGPGVGPIGVVAHLKPFLPGHPLKNEMAVSAAPYGSASILPISWAYVAMMGAAGLTKATQVAVLNANYIAARLSPHFPVVYKGNSGLVAHECILDMRQFKATAEVTVDDIAKRLMDYGFHAPTMSFPVAGTLMIEPTESESKAELDRFCDAMISIREEIREIENGKADRADNVLKHAPHTVGQITSDKWSHAYGREKAAFPLPWVRERKFWPSVGRVDNVFGDRNIVCACPPVSDY